MFQAAYKMIISIIFLTVFLTTIPTIVQLEDPTNVPTFPYKEQIFTLETKFRIIKDDKKLYSYHFEESYSAEQRRSKINLMISNDAESNEVFAAIPKVGYLFVDKKDLLVIDTMTRKCQLIPFKLLDEFLQSHLLEPWKLPEEKLYLSGPAKFLVFLNDHRDKFSKINDPPGDIQATTRNVPSDIYEFIYSSSKSSNPIKFQIHYSSLNLRRDNQVIGVPLKVSMYLDKDHWVEMDYILLHSSVDTYFKFNNRFKISDQTIYQDPIFDQFALGIMDGCAVSDMEHITNPLGQMSDKSHSFSFSANDVIERNNDNSDEPSLSYIFEDVAYMAQIDSLRVTAHLTKQRTISITNYHLGRSYHVIDAEEDHPNLDKIKQLVRMDPASASGTSSCVVLKAQSTLNNLSPYTVSDLLIGKGQFIYIGQAQIQGQRTRVYEAHNTKLPYWLDPLVITKGKESDDNDSGDDDENKSGTVSTTVIYLICKDRSDRTTDADICSSSKEVSLKRVEIYWKFMSKILKKQTITISNFKWRLEPVSDDDERATDLFSLLDLCPAPSTDGTNNYAKVDMDLYMSSSLPYQFEGIGVDKSWLNVAMERNLALLDEFQRTLKIPATMIYDLESRLPSIDGSQKNKPHLNSMPISFRLAQHKMNIVELVDLGKGSIVINKRNQLVQFSEFSFESCVVFAAHTKLSTFIGYSKKLQLCLIDSKGTILNDKKLSSSQNFKPESFELKSEGVFEIFLLTHEDDITMRDLNPIANLAKGEMGPRHSKSMSRLRLFDSNGQNPVEFTIVALEVNTEMSLKKSLTVPAPDGSARIQVGDMKKIIGFGLLPLDSRNTLITGDEFRTLSDSRASSQSNKLESDTTLTFEQCYAACLSDLNCKSISFCNRAGQVECIVSSWTFSSSETMMILIRLKDQLKSGKISDIQVDTTEDQEGFEKIQIKRDDSCELHGKRYLDLFEDEIKILQTFSNRRVFKLDNREQCAQMCFDQTITVLRDYVYFGENLKKIDQSDTQSLVEHFEQHRKIMLDICRSFLYLEGNDLISVPSGIQERLKKFVINPDDSTQRTDNNEGYCMIGERPSRNESALFSKEHNDKTSSYIPQQYIKFRKYPFKFATFFERHNDVSLKATKKSRDELIASIDIEKNGRRAHKSSFELMVSFVNRGENNRETLLADEFKCALICFGQTWNPWPACQSFDITLRSTADQTRVMCNLNSVSLKDAMYLDRRDLIEVDGREDERVWHFEPKPGFVREALYFDREYSLKTNSWQTVFPTHSYMLGLLIVVLSSAFGIYLGIKLSSIHLDRVSNVGASESGEYRDIKYMCDEQVVEFMYLDGNKSSHEE